MADRFSPNFNVLTGRQPVKRSPSGSKFRELAGVVKTELDDLIAAMNIVYNAKRLTTCDVEFLPKFGVRQGLPGNGGETDEDYRDRLLLDFRNVPEGINVQSIYDAIFAVTDPDVPVIYQWYQYRWEWPDSYEEPELLYFGNNSVGASSTTIGTNTKVACRFQITDPGALGSIKAYLEAVGGGDRTAHCAIYDDNAGVPNDKVADAQATVTVNDAGWYEFSFDSEALTEDDYYWLTINVTGGSWNIYYDTGSANQAAYNTDTPPPADPFGAVAGYNAFDMSIFAVYVERHPDFEGKNWCNSIQTRFTLSAALIYDPGSSGLDTIEANVIQVKPAHIMVRIVQVRPEGYDLLREIL